ncbi:hypothetical protein CEQ15_11640 [Chryseobacterium indologenes]|uniref:hypothetical protein n=1 Tax=Chryseobacterium indologenes TaxID=253 RepID=UPI000CFB3616|nr:hypothetical protein [Chryseobacterium indologenes]ASE62097.2 hypothetical protein CEQ15_11640 [Chryseobacterium indologenes]
MKPLHTMNNTERAYTLARLFPENLKDLITFTQKEITHFREKQEDITKAWPPRSLITANYWYTLISEIEKLLKDFNVQLYRSPKIFSEHLFWGHNSIFMTHCLIRFVECENPHHSLKLAIELLFGEKEVVSIEFTENKKD